MTHTLRIVHTSDWHLGHSLKRQSREHEHAAFLAWLLRRLEEVQADALLVAGDIFHTSSPSASARRMFYDFIVALRHRMPDLTPIVIGGNHDSAAHLDAPDKLFEALGVKVVGGMRWTHERGDAKRALMPIHKDGEVAAWVAAVPFLRRSDLEPAIMREGGHAKAVAHAYDVVLEQARARREPHQPLLAMGHGTMRGGQHGDSERTIFGGEESLPATVFGEDASYVALGHLHLAQAVEDHAHIRYSGSPIPLSMAEDGYPHQVLVVDFEGAALAGVTPVLVPRSVDLIRLQHKQPLGIDETLERLRAMSLEELPLERRPFLEVSVFLDRVEPNLAVEIRDALEGKSVRLVGIRTLRPDTANACLGDVVQRQELSDLEPSDVFVLMHERKHGSAPDDALSGAFAELQQRVFEVA